MNDPKVTQLEQQVRQLIAECQRLAQQVEFLTRENNRRKNDIIRIANNINKG